MPKYKPALNIAPLISDKLPGLEDNYLYPPAIIRWSARPHHDEGCNFPVTRKVLPSENKSHYLKKRRWFSIYRWNGGESCRYIPNIRRNARMSINLCNSMKLSHVQQTVELALLKGQTPAISYRKFPRSTLGKFHSVSFIHLFVNRTA